MANVTAAAVAAAAAAAAASRDPAVDRSLRSVFGEYAYVNYSSKRGEFTLSVHKSR